MFPFRITLSSIVVHEIAVSFCSCSRLCSWKFLVASRTRPAADVFAWCSRARALYCNPQCFIRKKDWKTGICVRYLTISLHKLRKHISNCLFSIPNFFSPTQPNPAPCCFSRSKYSTGTSVFLLPRIVNAALRV